MRKLGRLGLLTGTQVFSPSQFREKVRAGHHVSHPSFLILYIVLGAR